MLSLRRSVVAVAAAIAIASTAGTTSSAARSASDAETWQISGHEDGITVYHEVVPGSAIVALRGEGTIDAPPWKVAAVLLDTKRAPEWVDSLKESRVVRLLAPDEYIEYNHVGLPLILKDREFVSDVRIEVDASAHSVSLVYRPSDDAGVPRSRNVRGVIYEGAFRARSLGSGRGTMLTAELHCDPKGAIPAWVVNLFQKSWPRNTFRGLRRQVAKPDVALPDAFKDVLTPTIGY